MRILQIIDSLDAGGAETMAVNYANALSSKVEYIGLVVTRKEGVLKNKLSNNVPYFYLNKKRALDFKAIQELKFIVKQNKIGVIHAHGTSFFTAFFLKIFYFRIKIIYHEHYGNRANEYFFNNLPLLFCLFFFNKIIVVNDQLKSWFLKYGFKKTIFLSNYAIFDDNEIAQTKLFGNDNKRIVCLANLKNPKNHLMLLQSFRDLNLKEKNWTLHFVGKIYYDNYYNKIIEFIQENHLQNFVFLYNSQPDIKNILSQATIGALCSTNEGFPVTLLEYGLAKVPIICSNVGFCNNLIIDNSTGLIFTSNNVESLSFNLDKLASSIFLQDKFAIEFNAIVLKNFSQQKIINDLIGIYLSVNN